MKYEVHQQRQNKPEVAVVWRVTQSTYKVSVQASCDGGFSWYSVISFGPNQSLERHKLKREVREKLGILGDIEYANAMQTTSDKAWPIQVSMI